MSLNAVPESMIVRRNLAAAIINPTTELQVKKQSSHKL